ncbi:glycosyltransferase family 2 protein [Paraburkholderia sp. UCT31]|uniref:glycosyltransferase family 2 protein n=1 Tax=Paraburkholderia sp. UCT31 TaxID=2615209 RepID=UPI0016563A92|nr:glycosyltransferase family 2 protein [Paraburkholderia sp. UCT31]MBC8738495.1 glycosyltransferase family 2 protein [Paraburkholderia sp. UCT31]
MSGETLSVVVPARDEEATVADVLLKLRALFPDAELILVDNGSTDETIAKALTVEGVRVICDERPGKGFAMRSGAEAATGTFVLFHDADPEYDVRDAGAVVNAAMDQNGAAIGVRVVSFENLRWSSWLANRLIQELLLRRFGVKVPDVLSGTRCMRRDQFTALHTTSTGFGIETEMTVALLAARVPLGQAPVRYAPRTTAQGKKIRFYHLFTLLRLALAPIRHLQPS